ncbi:MAG: thioesterase family protein [Patescibacteria group bacterium]|nr:thioesterase family protein [Patescibacteria group bacterium]
MTPRGSCPERSLRAMPGQWRGMGPPASVEIRLRDVFRYCHTVVSAEIDVLGHANNVAYVEWMQQAALAHSAALGWPFQRYKDHGSGWVARSHRIDYRQPALPGDEIVVETWVATMQKVTSVRQYRILRVADAKLLADAETKWAFINFATGQPVRIPAEISAAFAVRNAPVLD